MHKLGSIIAESFRSSREADAVQKLLESSVGPQRIEGRTQQDGCLESGVIALVQPANRLIRIAESNIDQRDIRIEGGVLIMPAFQVLDYFYGFFPPSRDRVSIAEVGVKGSTVPGNLDSFLKFRDGLVVQLLLLERLAQFVVTNGKIRIQPQCFPALPLGFVKLVGDGQRVRYVRTDDQGKGI